MNRLDVELVLRGFAPTRAKAQEIIKSEKVLVDGKIKNKPSFQVDEQNEITVLENNTLKFVSRAGLKLEEAIKVFSIDFNGKTVLDIGSSTGGFTDCALQNGATKIIACDVGTGVMHESLRKNAKVELHEQTDIRKLDGNCFKNLDYTICDVSFISLEKIFEKLANENVSCPCIMLIKPQFECGMEIAKKFSGVPLNKTVHQNVINKVVSFANKFGFYLLNIAPSPIKGGDGNIEYISMFSNKPDANANINIEKIIDLAFEK